MSAVSVLVVSLWFLYSPAGSAQAPSQGPIRTYTPQKISLVVGKSLVIDTPVLVKRVSLANPEIAETVVISPRQIYLTGKAVGMTNLTLWGADDRVSTIFDVTVAPDLSQLKEKLQEILPGENIRVNTAHDSITLSGEVSSTANLSQALAVTETFAPKKVVNLTQVSGVHQVMLEVRVAEMSRSLARRLGFNLSYVGAAGDFGISRIGNLISTLDISDLGLNATFSQNVNALFRFLSGNATVTGFIDALKENGLVKILAEPTLVTLSGQSANFLAGGEFPIPVPQEEGAITIEFKTFGVGLSFAPTVLNDKKISMTVSPEVSDLDFANAVVIAGGVVPALTTRRASTTIELADGQSFAIAGLLRENVRQVVSKFPLLGDIPILGVLFRSTSFQKNETELVIIVTTHLVKPLDMAKQTLPTDAYIEPDDFEFYLLGVLEGRGAGQTTRKSRAFPTPNEKAGLEGKFGHLVP
ncbi:MAG TPA: type II and III secretion system protein family protein [Candidatus Tectomicrobia bacterium]|nr:type II and III secretion system protein family protein [Candidatus Tectomicrobia bacterium]